MESIFNFLNCMALEPKPCLSSPRKKTAYSENAEFDINKNLATLYHNVMTLIRENTDIKGKTEKKESKERGYLIIQFKYNEYNEDKSDFHIVKQLLTEHKDELHCLIMGERLEENEADYYRRMIIIGGTDVKYRSQGRLSLLSYGDIIRIRRAQHLETEHSDEWYDMWIDENWGKLKTEEEVEDRIYSVELKLNEAREKSREEPYNEDYAQDVLKYGFQKKILQVIAKDKKE